ncbi:AAA family ATPase [Bosea sp. F3-2]|uniref:AAA family ATPase n=1 Tax=Bosea sp. F3-2 TaxID=2599640 RepID=UPI0011EC34E7|nr:AAA family ATPase [Bosea sp. F3-2]QEL21947.1 AAA family ATPase [Bosea sp. F3-2]
MSPRSEKRGPGRTAVDRDASTVVAKSLITRALRRANTYHLLHGQPGIVALVVPEADADIYVDVAHSMLKRSLKPFHPDDFEVVRWTGKPPKAGFRSEDEALKALLPKTERIFGIACRTDDIPSLFRNVADAIIEVDSVDLRALQGVFGAILGHVPAKHDLAPVVGAPLHLLGAAIKSGRNPGWALRRLRGFTTAASEPTPQKSLSGPSLSDLHGYGEAAAWGHALAIDIADYRAGKITWADVDRGIVLSGPPGVGKTIYARALANTCSVRIFVHSLARWQSKGYLSDLIKAMRAAFDEAKKNAPCILFLDELDAFGDREQLSGHNENYCREVINALLECLDGAESREGVVVVGATNLLHKIDAAILRPGRLDKHIRVPLPDTAARIGILRHYLGDAFPETALSDIAGRLEGATGAAIEQLVRNARRSARAARRALLVEDVVASLPERIRLSEAAFRRASVHEAGHAVVGHVLREETGSVPTAARLFREVLPDGSGGRTDFDHELGADRTRAFYLAQITTLLAGLAAEEVVFGNHGGGGGGGDQSDLHVATVLAASMETSLGLGQSLTYRSSNRPAEIMASVRADPELRRRVGARLEDRFRRARDIVGGHRPALDWIASALRDSGRVTTEDIESALTRSAIPADRSHSPDLLKAASTIGIPDGK